MASSSRFSTAYLISGLCTGSLSFAFVANATAYGVAANAGALVRSMVPSFGLFTSLLCVVTHIKCSGTDGNSSSSGSSSGSGSVLVKRRQFYLAQLATTCACLLLVVAGPALFAVTANETYAGKIECAIPGKTYRSILMDEIMLGAVMAGALVVCAVLGWLDGGSQAIFSDRFGRRRNGGLRPSVESGKAEPLSLELQGHRISAANKNRRPPTGVPAAAAAAAAVAKATTPAATTADTASDEASDKPASSVNAVGSSGDAETGTQPAAVAGASTADSGSSKGVKFVDEVQKTESGESASS